MERRKLPNPNWMSVSIILEYDILFSLWHTNCHRNAKREARKPTRQNIIGIKYFHVILVVATSSSEESDHLQDPDYLSNSLSSHSSKCSFIKSGFLSGYKHDLNTTKWYPSLAN
ncbi:unnamed protein product [Rhizophagus irregularis]|uniref:Uncharacterized protein n=1 Tax=Rhizophagus irregularis TaxID=588596 RepID=A0A915ZAH4_9GLOM|nr:unnamed protein product [Rhizophagus irregularis]CAB5204825.1 unnamed protein product [Rhizophagus irregularis]CAB5366905.1 unnamed protein product [Rhizophagus irregularis]CAB5392729.1 unnamed protein product [Rhizophagus irregularis]